MYKKHEDIGQAIFQFDFNFMKEIEIYSGQQLVHIYELKYVKVDSKRSNKFPFHIKYDLKNEEEGSIIIKAKKLNISG